MICSDSTSLSKHIYIFVVTKNNKKELEHAYENSFKLCGNQGYIIKSIFKFTQSLSNKRLKVYERLIVKTFVWKMSIFKILRNLFRVTENSLNLEFTMTKKKWPPEQQHLNAKIVARRGKTL